MISKAARHLGVDQVEIRKINAPVTGSRIRTTSAAGRSRRRGRAAAASGARAGAPPDLRPSRSRSRPSRDARREEGRRPPDKLPGAAACRGRRAARGAAAGRSSRAAILREALDLGAQLFKWDERKRPQRPARRNESHRRRRRPRHVHGRLDCDGRTCCSCAPTARSTCTPGIGNLGTGSVHDCSRIVAEELGIAVGADRDGLGQHEQASRVELAAGGQPDDSRAHARESRGGAGSQEEASGDRGARARRPSGKLYRGQRPCRAR